MTEKTCPVCGADAWRESADVGVGIIYGPFGCSECGWSEDEEYDQITGKGGVQADGSYTTPQGDLYPKSSPVAIAMRTYKKAEETKE